MKVEQIAEVCHEANRAYCATIGGNSLLPWVETSDRQRTSAVNAVRFHLANPDARLSHGHNEWMKKILAAGGRYGPIKDAKKKEHPCLVPYEGLPAERKARGALFVGVVHALRHLIGGQVKVRKEIPANFDSAPDSGMRKFRLCAKDVFVHSCLTRDERYEIVSIYCVSL